VLRFALDAEPGVLSRAVTLAFRRRRGFGGAGRGGRGPRGGRVGFGTGEAVFRRSQPFIADGSSLVGWSDVTLAATRCPAGLAVGCAAAAVGMSRSRIQRWPGTHCKLAVRRPRQREHSHRGHPFPTSENLANHAVRERKRTVRPVFRDRPGS